MLAVEGIVFVSADRSGNEEPILERRVALALVATANVLARQRIDPSRVYVGGFSGGSRVALRLALSHPDLFRGLVLNAGSDPVCTQDAPLPTRDLLRLFQRRTRIAFVTGADDEANVDKDRSARVSLHDHCVANVRVVALPRTGHEAAPSAAFRNALHYVDGGAAPHAECEARLDADVAADLSEVEALHRSGDTRAAQKKLEALDKRYGRLAGATGTNPPGGSEISLISE